MTNEGWSTVRLEEIASRIMVGIASAATHAYRTDGIPLIRNQNIKATGIDASDLLFIDPEYEEIHRNKRLKAGDVLTVRTGYPGLSAVVDARFDNAQCFTCLITRPNPEYVRSDFLCYYINSSLGGRFFTSSEAGGAQKNVNAGVLKKLPINLPPLSEQKEIAAILSMWDRAIELTEKLIAAKQKRKQALMQQLLSGKVRFAEFEGKPWKQVRLGDLLKEVKRMVEWDDNAEYHLLSIRRRSGGMFDRETKLGHDIKTKVMMTTETGDFVIARMQAVHGAITVTPPECHGKHVSGSYSTFIAKDPDKLHMPFLNYVSQTLSFYRLLLLSAYGVTIEKMTFNLPWFLNEKIEMPPTLAEQKRIADVFDSFERENAALGRRLESLKQQKKGLMQQLLTGKVRVTVDQETVKG